MSSAAAASSSGVQIASAGAARVITLDRPKAMNALTLDMIRAIKPHVGGWTADGGVSCVILEGSGEKAFCAGGDIKLLHGGGQDTASRADQEAFFREEYELDYALALSERRGAPLVAVCDGITMGGGVGVSIHAPVRIATERYVFAMPETAIGLFPDVGGSYFLPRLPHSVGKCLALTGDRVKGPEAPLLGLATDFVHSSALPELRAALEALPAGCGLPAVRECVAAFASAPTPSGLASPDARSLLDAVFGGDDASVSAVVARANAAAEAAAAGDDEARAKTTARWAKALAEASPTSLCVTHEQVRRGASLSLQDCFGMELRLALRFMQRPDFYAGVSAAIIDRTGSPVWSPDSIEAVEASGDVDRFFAPLTAQDMPEGRAPRELNLTA